MKKNLRPLRVLVSAFDVSSNICKIRIATPLDALEHEGLIQLRKKPIHALDGSDLLWSDVFLLQRDASRRALRWVDLAKKLKRSFVFEIDDLLTDSPSFLLGYEHAVKNRHLIQEALDKADAISTSTPRLAKNLGEQHSQKIHVTPNYSQPTPLPPARQTQATPEEPASIVLAASDSVFTEFLEPALQKLAKIYGSRIQIIIIGPLAKKLCIESAKKIPILPLSEFRSYLSSLSSPIGIIPLDDSTFSSCKSAVKYFDYSLSGVVSICSDVPPYSDVIEHGKTGLLTANTPDDWLKIISDTIENAAVRQSISAQAQASVLANHSLGQNIEGWKQLLRTQQRHMILMPSRAGIAGSLVHASYVGIRYGVLSKIWGWLKALNRKRLARRHSKN